MVVSVVPLMITTEDVTKWLPFSVSTRFCWVWAKVAVSGDRDPRTGAGRALRHKGLSALQLGKRSRASRSALRGCQEARIRCIHHGTRGWLVSSRKQYQETASRR